MILSLTRDARDRRERRGADRLAPLRFARFALPASRAFPTRLARPARLSRSLLDLPMTGLWYDELKEDH